MKADGPDEQGLFLKGTEQAAVEQRFKWELVPT